jgi:choline dehydrogenase-like flavoprotein
VAGSGFRAGLLVEAFIASRGPSRRLGALEGRLMVFRGVEEFERSGFRPRVFIIGSGPAGTSVALRLQERGVPCLIVEAGGLDFSEQSQDVYRGEVVGDPYHKLHEARLRQFGGTSGHWTGWVCPLDASDFEPRSHVPNSGWPIRIADVEPYSTAADTILQIKPHLPDRPMTDDIDYIHYRYSPPVRFGTHYRETILQSRSIGLLVNTPVLELVPGQNRVDAARVSAGPGATRDIKVDQICVCTGGIENSRLLLWSNARHQGKVVPHARTLGRYWMEHPVHVLADVITTHGYEMQFEDWKPENWQFAPSERAKRAYGIGGAHIWMRPHQPNSSYLKELVHQVACVAPDWSNRILRHLGKEYHCGGLIMSEFEQFPVSENRIELDMQHTDALGVPRARLFWRKFDSERKTATVVTRLLGEALVKADIGRLRMRNYLTFGTAWPVGGQTAGWHHMGGTRMSDSSETGVVDGNCKVFGMDNLYVGGSSVFTTGGHASPTYNIVRLALRLGDHMARKLGEDDASGRFDKQDRFARKQQ